MRCVQFQRKVKKTNLQTSSPITPPKPSSITPLHQPTSSCNTSLTTFSVLESVLATSAAASPSVNGNKSSMIRRSRRECAKNQSSTRATSNLPNSTTLRSSNGAVSNQTSRQSRSSSNSTATSLKSLHQENTLSSSKSNLVMQRPNHLETTRTGGGGGRHPYPPSANNAKLKHKCPFDGCPWRFATPYKLRRHIKSHTKETPYLCKECGRGFSVRYNLLMHIQTIHSQPQKYKCPIRGCKDAFHSQSRLNGHLRRIHKKDWKSLQGSKDMDVKLGGGSRGSSTSSTDSDHSVPSGNATPTGARKTRLPSAPHKCPHCPDDFTSKAKLAVHIRSHAPDKPYKCIVQGCDKCFPSQEKLSRHAETHKNSKQFCCPHKNCNRIFLRQSHLKNHLKIHTQDHQFVCPVLDCSQKFASESAYNVHLNTHINYGYNCPHPGCELSFLSRKRLAIHSQVVHNMPPSSDTGINSPLLDGIQPHLGMSGQQTSLCSPSSSSLISLSSGAPLCIASKPTPISSVVDKEFIKHVDLPGLSADDIEAVLSENEDWSGEQIDQFLRSAVDLSEIESKLFSLASYESDSGYSAYDVSPITSTAPAHPAYSNNQVSIPSCPPPLTLVNHATPPLFSNPTFSRSLSLPHHPPSLVHEPTVSPCASDGGFFSPHSNFGSLENTPNQESIPFFPSPNPVSMYSQSFPQSHDYNMSGSSIFSISNPCFPDISSSSSTAIPNFSLQIPDIILHDIGMNQQHQLPCSVAPPTTTRFPSCSHEEPSQSPKMVDESASSLTSDSQVATTTTSVKVEKITNGLCCDANELVSLPKPVSPTKPVSPHTPRPSCSASLQISCLHTDSKEKVSGVEGLDTCAQSHRYVEDAQTSNNESESPQSSPRKGKTGIQKVGKMTMKGSTKKKTQWPRSMNRANLMAFREHILNKLKKSQEVATEPSSLQAIPIPIFTGKNTTSSAAAKSSPSSSVPPLIKCEASSPNSNFEVQVKYERNHVTPERCHSEPANLQDLVSNPSSASLHNSLSDSNINFTKVNSSNEETKLFDVVAGDYNDLFSVFSFNPDTLLSSQLNEKMLDDWGLKFEGGVDSEIADFLGDSDKTAMSSSLEEVETMDIDSIQELLDDSEKCQSLSPSSSPVESPQDSQGHCTPLGSCSSPASLSRSDSPCLVDSVSNPAVCKGESCQSNSSPQNRDAVTDTSFRFPEIVSVDGSMVLDGVSILSDEDNGSKYHIQHAFLQSHHDPLLAGSHGGLLGPVEFFEI